MSMNGHPAPEPAQPEDENLPGLTPEQIAKLPTPAAPLDGLTLVKKSEDVLDSVVRQPLGIVLRGLMVSTPGIPADALLRSVARVMASLMGEAIMGDIAPVLRARAGFKKAFEEGLSKAPIKSPPAPTSMSTAPLAKR